MSHVLLDSARILLQLCIMFNEESTAARGGHYNIFFALSYRAIEFALSEKVRALDKVFYSNNILAQATGPEKKYIASPKLPTPPPSLF